MRTSGKLGAAAVMLVVLWAGPGGSASTSPGSVAGQAAARPAVVERLMGTWTGTGVVLGRAASIAMTWEPAVGNAFVRQRFRNEMAATDALPAMVLEAHGN